MATPDTATADESLLLAITLSIGYRILVLLGVGFIAVQAFLIQQSMKPTDFSKNPIPVSVEAVNAEDFLVGAGPISVSSESVLRVSVIEDLNSGPRPAHTVTLDQSTPLRVYVTNQDLNVSIGEVARGIKIPVEVKNNYGELGVEVTNIHDAIRELPWQKDGPEWGRGVLYLPVKDIGR